MRNFYIELLNQYWIDESLDDGKDLCSHGKVLLEINGRVLNDNLSCDRTVVTTAMRLMKSALIGYDGSLEYAIVPCCGDLYYFDSCPEYITWDTEIVGDSIHISNVEISKYSPVVVEKIDETIVISKKEYYIGIIKFAEAVKEFLKKALPRKLEGSKNSPVVVEKIDETVVVSKKEYYVGIIKFAEAVKEFYKKALPRKLESYDEKSYDEFWILFYEYLLRMKNEIVELKMTNS